MGRQSDKNGKWCGMDKGDFADGREKRERNETSSPRKHGKVMNSADGREKWERNETSGAQKHGKVMNSAEGREKRERNETSGSRNHEKAINSADGREKRRKDEIKPIGAGTKRGENEIRPESLRKTHENTEKDRESRKTGNQTDLCPVYRQCGGCQLLHLPYDEQLRKKQKDVEQLLKGICAVHEITGMENPFHYRNKVHAVFGHKKGEAISGIYQEGSHKIVPVETCMIEDEKADEIIGTIRDMLRSFKIKTYDEDTGYGLLRHVLVKRGFATGEIMVVLVTSSPVFPSRNNFVKALREKHPEITTIIQNLNDRSTSMVLGDREKVLYGKGFIEDELCGCRFRISSRSFYQINLVQTEKLYAKAIQLAGLTGRETVIDAYCGIGTIGIIAGRQAGRVIGVELNPDAVGDARTNAKLNRIDNIQFYQNDASVFMTQMAEQGGRADLVFMDPPRSGSTEEFIQAASLLKPSRIVYISCNPETLARDLKVFKGKGYQTEGAWPFDLFAQTGHVETVVCLSQQKPDDVIRVGLDLDELEVTPAEAKATYGEIKAYVKEHTGLAVSSLYIAQVKQKYGIIERENYNKSKSEDVRQPKCPEDKEKAIVDALQHFQMINSERMEAAQ